MTNSVRQEIAAIAARMHVGELGLLEGCRKVVSLTGNLSDADQVDTDLLVLVAVESELDHIPLGRTRDLWAPHALEEKDKELARNLDFNREYILSACRALSDKWGT